MLSVANGTFINFSKRLSNGERFELKSGDEIFVINPKHSAKNSSPNISFLFFNMRDRLFDKREKSTLQNNLLRNPTTVSGKQNAPHIEDYYIIGDVCLRLSFSHFIAITIICLIIANWFRYLRPSSSLHPSYVRRGICS